MVRLVVTSPPDQHLNHTSGNSSSLSSGNGGAQTSPDGSLPPSPPLIHQSGGATNTCAIQQPQHQQQQIAALHQPQHLPAGPMNHHHIHHHHHSHQNENGHGTGGGGSVTPGPTGGPNAATAGGGGLYIPYTGEFYPAEHGYFIHPEMCPAHHPAMCTMPSEFGPTTVQMVSQNRPPPIPVPVQVPQGQVMQQYVNESGTLTHVVLSPSQYQQLHTGQGAVTHLHAPFITANGTTSHFYGPLATGFPGPGGGPHYHPIPSSHIQPQPMSHSPHSPSPPNNYHKDERTQRQHSKLLRKLDQKREMSSTMSTPAHSPSPRKNDLNGLRRTSRNGASSVGTSEDGEESSSVPDEEDDCQTIVEQLSAVQKPEVTDITSRSAMLRWEAPPLSENLLNSRDLRYDVLLSDRGKEGKYKIIFKGESYVCMIQDLRPGQEYFVCLQVHFDKLQGSASEPTVFTTPPCEPDQPIPPKLIARTKNSLQLRWNAPLDNGSHILNYILEYNEGKGKEFVEIIKTKGKQYTLNKLQPSTSYSFRLCAINECGPSLYSDVVTFSTCGNPPITPKPPTLQSASSNSLRLAWERRAQDEEFILQMSDRESGHGFLNMYSGLETSYECKGLKRSTSYQFRIRADNEAGSSPWSNEVNYKTQPERPGKPAKPQIKGKIHGTHFKVKWDPPNDRGGADIRKYYLEISSGAKFERIYTGSEAEAVCDRLSPGTTYQIRVACEGPGGMSAYSDVSTVTTEAVVPGIPNPPICDNLPGPYAAVLRWDKPDYNGGAPVLEYEIQLNGLNYEDQIIYRGKDSYCIVKDLSPGENYQACVRAVNRIGAGPWSDQFAFSAGAAPPLIPDPPEICVRSATHLTVSWKEPVVNGAPILEYQLESSNTNNSSDSFSSCYQGLHTSADMRNLIPYTIYYFRVNASNSAGTSLYSPIVSTQTPAAAPSAVQIKHYEITAHDVTLHWTEPDANGSNILHYLIEYGDKSVSTEENITEYTIKNLASETSYKFKVQAVNGIGAGQFSNPLKLTTLPPPPDPPKLECTGFGHNFIKLKWGDGRNVDFTNYYVEMYNTRAKEFQVVHSGTSFMCKVNKLQEQTTYIFRICAETDRAGFGEYSDEYMFKTSATQPSTIKVPRIVDTNSNSSNSAAVSSSITGSHSNLTGITGTPCYTNPLTVEWQHSKNAFPDPVEYILQQSSGKDSEYTEIYRGSETRYTIGDLEPGSTYLFRVCPVRVTSCGDLPGAFTSPLRYQVPHRSSVDSVDAAHSVPSTNHLHHRGAIGGSAHFDLNNHSDDLSKGSNGAVRRCVSKCTAIYTNRRRLSDQEKAILWVVFFMAATACCAALVRMCMS